MPNFQFSVTYGAPSSWINGSRFDHIDIKYDVLDPLLLRIRRL